MGTYTYGEYLETFGGVPEPGEYAPDLRELADRRRDEADEFPWQTVAAPAAALPPCGGTCGPEGCMARGCPVGQDVGREDER